MAKKSLTKTEYYDKIIEHLEEEHEYEEGEFTRKDIGEIIDSVIQVAIINSTRKNGCGIPGLGKVFQHFKKGRKGGGTMISPFNGETIKLKAKKPCYVGKLRVNKAFKDNMSKVAPKIKKKKKR